MARYIVRRLLQVPFLLLGVTLITFCLLHLTPGSPIDRYRVLIPGISQADLARIEQTLGTNRPLTRQYLGWVSQLTHGDLGLSLIDRRPVLDHVFERFPNTALLVGLAMALSLLIAIPAGILAAVKRNSLFDQAVTGFSTLGSAVPSFWIGLLLILTFSVQAKSWGLPTLPSSGMRSLVGGGGMDDRIQHLILPVATLCVIQISGWMRYVRAQMLEVLGQDYVRTARSKGLAETIVICRHAFRNSLLPLVTLVGLSLPEFVAGAAVVEVIFSWPGLGALGVQAAANRDYTLVIGLTVFVAATTLLSNLLTDVLYAVVDPRIKYR